MTDADRPCWVHDDAHAVELDGRRGALALGRRVALARGACTGGGLGRDWRAGEVVHAAAGLSSAQLLVALGAVVRADAQLWLPQGPDEASQARLRASQPGCVVDADDARWASWLHEGNTPRDTADAELTDAGGGASTLAAAMRPPGGAVIVHTSGSTGVPVAWHKPFAALHAEACALAALFELTPTDRVLCSVPRTHLYGLLNGLLVPAVAGATVVDGPSLHIEELCASLATGDISHWVTTPAHVAALGSLDALPRGRLRTILCSGAPLDPRLAARTAALTGADVVELLGSTETGGLAWRVHGERPRLAIARGLSVEQRGALRPLPGVRLWADEDERLWVDSPFDPREGPQQAQDRVRVLDDGAIVHLGRVDDVVKVSGRRVSLGAVERAVRACTGVLDAAVRAVPDAVRGAVIEVVYAGATPTAQARRELETRLPPGDRPRRVLRVPSLPRTAMGKLSRVELDAVLDAPMGSLRPFVRGPGACASDGLSWSAPLEIDDSLELLADHFPGSPIVPGVAVLGLFDAIAREQLGVVVHAASRVKFARPCAPGVRYEVRVHRSDDGARVTGELRLHDGDVLCVRASFVARRG